VPFYVFFDLVINIKIAITIAKRDGVKELKKGLNSKLNESAPPSLEINSKDNPIDTPTKIFLPRVISLVDPKINNMDIKIIAIRVNGFTILL
jgi:hypothetical protein